MKLTDIKFKYRPLYLIFNKDEWMANTLFGWTEEEIDNANEKGLIGTKWGVDCYLSRPVKAYRSY